jgi:PKD repeat protein
MTRGAGDSFYLSRSYGQVGLHTFTVTATDAWGTVAVAGGSFAIWAPNAPPAISNVAATPDPQESGGRVNVTARVLDSDGLSAVTVLITYPDASSVTRSMLPAGGGVWFYDTSYSALGTYGFAITATDGNGTFPRFAQANGSFVVQDTTDPTASAGPDQTVLQGDTVTFDGSGSSDNHGIQSYVWTFTDVVPVTLTDVSPTYTFLRIGIFLVTLTVFDLSGRTGTDTMTVTVRDVTPPIVVAFAANPNPAESPGSTNASFAVVEANTVAVAKVAAYDPGDQLLGNVTALYDPGSGRFFQVWTLAALGSYRFVAYVEDGSGNFAVASTTVNARDTTAPAAVAPVAAPNPVQVLAATTLSAQVSDPYLTGVSVQIRDPAATPVANLTMAFNATTGRYEASYTPTIPGGFTFVVWALDSSGNVGSVAGSFTSADTVPPTLSALAVTPQPANVGATVDISVLVVDDFRIDRVWMDLTDPFGTPVGTFDLVFTVADGRWHDVRAYSQAGTYTFTIFAHDGTNTASLPGQVVVADTIPPTVGPLSKAPVTWEIGGTILVQATVTDDVAIQGPVKLQVIDPLGVEAGNHTMACSPAHVCTFSRSYGIAGTYNLHVWAFDASGNVGTNADALVIAQGQPPVADAGPDLILVAGGSAAFDASGSSDDYGIVSYNWTFTYRGRTVALTSAAASFVFEDPGAYTVTLIVTDSGGRTGTDTLSLTVQSAGLSPLVLGGLAIVILLAMALGGWLVLRRARAREKEPEQEPVRRDAERSAEPLPEDRPKPARGAPTDEEVDKMLEELDELESL